MSDDCAFERSGATDDEELREVDQRSEETAKEDHPPHVCGSLVQWGEFIGPGDDVQEKDAS